MSRILTADGGYFNFLDFDDSKVTLYGIAHALSNICRFGGHAPQFYSVAQHSYYVSQVVPPEYALYGLLHDAAEAYLGDMVKPLKDLLPQFQTMESQLVVRIFREFNLAPELPECVKYADRVLLGTEQRDIMRNSDDWGAATELPLFELVIKPWTPERARTMFLERYYEITGTR